MVLCVDAIAWCRELPQQRVHSAEGGTAEMLPGLPMKLKHHAPVGALSRSTSNRGNQVSMKVNLSPSALTWLKG